MSEASQALQKIAKGTGIVFAGTVICKLFQFLSRTLIVGYRVSNLAITVLNIALAISTLYEEDDSIVKSKGGRRDVKTPRE